MNRILNRLQSKCPAPSRLVLGHHSIVQMIHVVHGHLGDQHSRAQSQHGGQQVLILTQETADHGPAEDRAKAEQQSSSGTKEGRNVINYIVQE